MKPLSEKELQRQVADKIALVTHGNSFNNLDPDKRASIAYAVVEMVQLILSDRKAWGEQEFKRGQRVGQYQAADKLYGSITTMWLFKDNNEPKLEMPERADNLLKDCEKYLNHNRKVYYQHVQHLAQRNQKGSL